MKRWLAMLLVSVLILGSLSGCATGASDEAPASEEPVTIKYMTFSAAPNHIEDLEAMIAAFEAEHPNIRVDYEAVGWNDYFTKLQTLVASGTAPDTFELNYENFVTYASKDALYDMDTLIAADDAFDPAVFNTMALEAFTHEGKQYGLVESFSNVVLFYNKDLFDAAGVAYPEADWTWEDELAAAEQLTDADKGIWGTYSPIQFWEFYKTIEQNGGQILNEDKTEVLIDSPQNVETLTWMIDKIEKYGVTPTDAQMSGQSDGDLFKSGKIAMLRSGIWMFDAFSEADFAWDIALEPGNTQKAHHFFSNGVAISKETENAEAAWEWVKFFTSHPNAVEQRVESSWELPAVSDEAVLEAYLTKTPPQSREVVFQALDTLVVPPVIGNWNQLTDVVGKELDLAKMGEKTPEEALRDAKAQLEKLLDESNN